MRIISKFKDYYDFLVGKYGIDELKILDRTLTSAPVLFNEFEFIFCDTTYGVINKDSWSYKHKIKNNNFYEILLEKNNSVWYKTKQKNNFKQPIVKINYLYSYNTKAYDKENHFYNFSLSKIGFNEVMSPEECYLKIESHLSKEDVLQTIPTDLNRFEAKGFDKKTSFRKM